MWKRQNEWGGHGQNVAEKAARLLVRLVCNIVTMWL